MKLYPFLSFAAVFSLVFSLSIPAYAIDQAYDASLESLGDQLERQMWDAVKNQNMIEVENKIAPEFQSIHSDGARDRAGEIDLMTNLNLGEYFFSNFQATRNGDTIVVTYFVNVQETIDSRPSPQVPTPRMSVWKKNENGIWQWVAHANLG